MLANKKKNVNIVFKLFWKCILIIFLSKKEHFRGKRLFYGEEK